MKKSIIGVILIMFFLMAAKPLFAHPPTSMKLNYDPIAQTLHIEIEHVSSHLSKHHIRAIDIYKNQEEAGHIVLPTQTTPQGEVRDVSLKALTGDTIQVKAICSRGGVGEESLVVPEAVPPEKK